MNCEKIKDKIDIRTVLESFNLFPVKENSKTAFYFALDREEKIPSFCVDFTKNKAFDFGTGKNYDIISIVQLIEKCSVSEALQYLKKFDYSHTTTMKNSEISQSYEIIKIQDIQNTALLQYLESRKVLEQKDFVKEIHYKLNGKLFFGIGFQNNSGGFEIRNKYSKICLGKKDVTLIKGENTPQREVCVFEGFFDFLSYCKLYKDENSDFIVLNSTAIFFKVENHLLEYDKINLFLDNDSNGKILTEKILAKYKNVEDCSQLYKDYGDINEWLNSTNKI
ncbi:toprim domain-containing protein [Frigoriflavimonas asaccharolytica]|uniref:5S rRNA maturation endonuclease (Ribonuclease M5) n=1 Tax=Frigoriflavimonas asaccharolytica TaxID=2735899 RepID=A0A8J8KCM2_9FLAO|nr:toprim domain-containing protein [Frigoriflavimonas asaccharolytica]NRS93799.1 5S rRNA maturation endonuclease (ribonuclease M5) [Frigoriflavimonas asaccharolytica]